MFYSGLVIAAEPSYSNGNEMYTDVKEPENLNKADPYKDQENENPLYEGADANDAVLNPIYGRFVCSSNSNCCFLYLSFLEKNAFSTMFNFYNILGQGIEHNAMQLL